MPVSSNSFDRREASPVTLAVSLLLAACLAITTFTVSAGQDEDCPQGYRYTFSWSLETDCDFIPRGGTTKGPEVTLDPEPHPGWKALQKDGLTTFERDRRAILAMAGPYRTSFEFLETLGYTEDFSRARPYQSWGTEYIYVLEDERDFISLQHILVMFVRNDEGELEGPFVQKHWRQDWQYEKQTILEYAGKQTWQRTRLDEKEYRGTWAQAVYHVDDSPRYESWGKWRHHENFSTWRGAPTWRPLPRRESSVRDDYQVLEARNVHSIIHNGWVHEQENYKVRLDNQGNKARSAPYLAKEQGVNRYERIVNFDFSAGDDYWDRTSPYWQDVRNVWQEFLEGHQQVRIDARYEGTPLFSRLFELEKALTAEGKDYDSGNAREKLRDILNDHVTYPDN